MKKIIFKIKLLICLSFCVYLSQAQPGLTVHYFRGNFTFYDCHKNKINFTTKDSITFFSKQNNFSFKIYGISGNSPNEKQYLKLGNTGNFYLFIDNKSTFLVDNIVSIRDNNYIINARKTIFEIEKNNKKMLICFDFKNYGADINLNNFNIYFQEGVYEVTDPNNPKLVSIKVEE